MNSRADKGGGVGASVYPTSRLILGGCSCVNRKSTADFDGSSSIARKQLTCPVTGKKTLPDRTTANGQSPAGISVRSAPSQVGDDVAWESVLLDVASTWRKSRLLFCMQLGARYEGLGWGGST